jgi:hypothetical protein
MEMRWGLTLVSFLPVSATEKIVKLQQEISNRWNKCSKSRNLPYNFYFEFYQSAQFHCTHFTLKRSTPCGPITISEFVKKNNTLFDLFNTISKSVSQIREIEVTLDTLILSPRDGVGLILLGQCANQDSVNQRTALLEDLNSSLPQYFNLSPRKWDTTRSHFHKIHTCIGFQKRQIPMEYMLFLEEMDTILFEPITFVLKEITLVHHKYRTLSLPQEGSFTFPFGKKISIKEDEFIRKLNMF